MSSNNVIKKRRWPILLAMAMCTAVVFLDSTILPVALPTIERELSLSSVELQWIVNSYLLVLACLILAGGKISDLYGHKRMYCVGMVVFGIASVLGGLSHTKGLLIFSRSLQGLGGAIMTPSSMSILVETYSPNERGRAVGLLVAIGSIFLSLGPFIGGFLTQYFTWRLVFWVNIPIVLIGISIALSVVPKSEKVKSRFDVLGFFTYTIALICLILGLMQAREWGWGSPAVITLFSLFIAFAALLVLRLRSVSYPFIDYHLFKNPVFLGGNLIILCAQFLLMMTIYWVIFFQKTLGYTPVQAGSLALTSTLPLIICAPLSGYLSDHYGPKVPVMAGFLLILVGFLWFAFLGHEPVVWILITGLLFFGCGIATVMTPIGTTTVSAVASQKRGTATGMYSTVRNTAAPFGVAVIGSVIANISFFKFKELIQDDSRFKGINLKYYLSSIIEGKSLVNNPDDLSEGLINYLKAAYITASKSAFMWANLLCAGVSIVGFVVCVIYFWKVRHHKHDDQSTAL
ncbi:MAG: putative multidrug resistance protein MdtD [Chlamydiia bacterium]|nr:putative multidrug resistance protein MdtD [Chlamydiia bacterium]